MLWVWIIVAAAAGGLAMLALFALWLWRKALALGGALSEWGGQLEGVLELLDALEFEPNRGPSPYTDVRT
ncbi:MAG: hypothetical protein IPL36_06380 [Nigerium sp.]|nr:hypothetical protein [Nigerium sp.]